MKPIEMIRLFYSPSGEGRLIAFRRNLKAKWYRYTPESASRINLLLNGNWKRTHVSEANRQDVITFWNR